MAADGSNTPTVFEHPTVQAARLRAKCERAVDKLLAMLDALGPDPDDEPWLGFREPQLRQYLGLDQRGIAESGTDDREDVQDDDEPSLCGVTADGMSRLVDRNDCEAEHDGREPDVDDEYTLGWAESESVAARAGSYPFSSP